MVALGLIEADQTFYWKKAKMLFLRLIRLLLLLRVIYIFNLAGSSSLIQISQLPPLHYQPACSAEGLVLTRR